MMLPRHLRLRIKEGGKGRGRQAEVEGRKAERRARRVNNLLKILKKRQGGGPLPPQTQLWKGVAFLKSKMIGGSQENGAANRLVRCGLFCHITPSLTGEFCAVLCFTYAHDLLGWCNLDVFQKYGKVKAKACGVATLRG